MKMTGLGDLFTVIVTILFTLIPLLLFAFLLRWIRILRVNSEIQIKQNEEMISLLKQIAEKKNANL